MIQANELRIGNYVVFNTNNRPFQITAATILEIYQIGEQEHPFNYEPIPLSEDWLVKFGFDKRSNNWYKKEYFTDCKECAERMIVQINLSSNRLSVSNEYDTEPIYTAKVCKHIHTLQNFWFALTGQELEVAE